MSTDHPYINDKRLLELLERWQTGDFTRADEQELLALSNSDDFRREAVEGFRALPEADHAAHLASLRLRLQHRKGRRVAFPPMWAAIAAVGLVILAVIWLIPNGEKNASTVQQEAAKPVEDPSIASNLPEIESGTAQEQDNSEGKQAKRGASRLEQASDPMFESGLSASTVSTEGAGASEPSSGQAVLDEISATKPEEKSDVSFSKAAQKDDVPVDAPGNTTAPAADKKVMSAPAKAKEAFKKQSPTPESQPEGGWSGFQEYLRRNARLPETARQNNISGSVRIKFRLDENNQPGDFQTLKPLGYGCEAEAIRLIQAFAWQRGINPEVTVDVPFVR
jgi:hypothetical protein